MKKPAAKSTAKPAAKSPKVAAKPAAATKSVVKKAVATVKKAVVAKKPAAPKAKVKSVAVTTTIVAAVDVGFGNTLTLRGTGPGLSWDAGVPMECAADDRWTITLPETSHPIICKFLLNDLVWSVGADYTILPGSSVVLSPTF
jgi:hypothetical protein